jgi:hypothetical protein
MISTAARLFLQSRTTRPSRSERPCIPIAFALYPFVTRSLEFARSSPRLRWSFPPVRPR